MLQIFLKPWIHPKIFKKFWRFSRHFQNVGDFQEIFKILEIFKTIQKRIFVHFLA